MKKRRHHYVWRHYLSSWATNEAIWCHRSGKVFNANLMNVGQERDFYSVQKLSPEELQFLKLLITKPYGEMDALINEGWIETFQNLFKLKELCEEREINDEKILLLVNTAIHNLEEDYHSLIEGDSIQYLDALLNDDASFYQDSDKAIGFLYFISLQYMRTKKVQENVVGSISNNLKINIKNIWPILRHVYATQIAKSIYVERHDYPLILLKNPTGAPLLTGDQPIINTFASKVRMTSEVKEIEFYYPISKDTAVLITNNKKYCSTRYILNYDEVCFYNNALIACSHEQVFSSCRHSLEFFCTSGT